MRDTATELSSRLSARTLIGRYSNYFHILNSDFLIYFGKTDMRYIATPILFLLSFKPASADAAHDCESGPTPDSHITGCSILIESPSNNPRNLAIYYGNRALAYFSKRDFEHAIADFSNAAKMIPDPYYYVGRGIVYAAIGDCDRAIDDYDEAIRLEPYYPRVYNNRGNCLRKKGDLDAAISDYSREIKINPNEPVVYFNRGVALKMQGKFSDAIDDLSRAVALNPKYAMAYFVRADTYIDEGDLDSADRDFKTASMLDPSLDRKSTHLEVPPIN